MSNPCTMLIVYTIKGQFLEIISLLLLYPLVLYRSRLPFIYITCTLLKLIMNSGYKYTLTRDILDSHISNDCYSKHWRRPSTHFCYIPIILNYYLEECYREQCIPGLQVYSRPANLFQCCIRRWSIGNHFSGMYINSIL